MDQRRGFFWPRRNDGSGVRGEGGRGGGLGVAGTDKVRVCSVTEGNGRKRGTWGRASGPIRRLAGGPGSPALCPLPRVAPRGPPRPHTSSHPGPRLRPTALAWAAGAKGHIRRLTACPWEVGGSRETWDADGDGENSDAKATFLQEASVRWRSPEKQQHQHHPKLLAFPQSQAPLADGWWVVVVVIVFGLNRFQPLTAVPARRSQYDRYVIRHRIANGAASKEIKG